MACPSHNPHSPSRTLTLRADLHFIRADGREGLATAHKGEKVKVTWHGAYMGSGTAYKRHLGTDWTTTITAGKGKEVFNGWPGEWVSDREENPPRGYIGAKFSELPFEYQAFIDKPFKGNVTWQHRDDPEDSVYKRDFTHLFEFENFLIDRYGARFAKKVVAEVKRTGSAVSRVEKENPSRRKLTGLEKRVYEFGTIRGKQDAESADVGVHVANDTPDIHHMFDFIWERLIANGEARESQRLAMRAAFERGYYDGLARRRNPLFLPKSLFDSYIVKSDGNEVSVDKIQTLSGAERKVRELARKYPCVGFSITSAKHGGTIKHYAASVGNATPKVDEDNSREYKQTQTKEAKANMRFRLYVNGNDFADYETKAEAEKVGRKEAGSGGRWRVKEVQANPSYYVKAGTRAYFYYEPPDPYNDTFSGHLRADRLPGDALPSQATIVKKGRGGKRILVETMIFGTPRYAWLNKDDLSYSRSNPLTGSPSHDIPLELRHGHSQRQAEAIAMEAERRLNPSFLNYMRSIGFERSQLLTGSDANRETYTLGTGHDAPEVMIQHPKRGGMAKWGYRHGSYRSSGDGIAELKSFLANRFSGSMENPLSIFPTRRAALAFASRTPGSSIIPAATGGYFVRYPVSRNPVVSGTGEVLDSHDDHDTAPYVNILHKYGYRYSHSVPVMSGSTRRIHHVWATFRERPATPDYPTQYSVGAWEGSNGWQWDAGKGGSGSHYTGRTVEQLDKYLKGLMRRIGTNAVAGRRSSSTLSNPSQQSRSSVQSIIAAGYKSAHPAAKAGWFDVVTPDGDPAALWHQGAGLYHVFFASRGTASGSSLERAYKGGLGDAISDDKEMRGYIRGVLSAPQALVNKYEGLREAQYQAENERRSSRRNPDDSGSAAELYEQFHGEPSDGETVYEETIETPDSFVELGDLIELKVATLHGKDVTISAPDPDRFDLHEIVKLASSPSGDQLYFIGGDQGIQLDKLGFKGDEVKPHMVIGVLYELTYRTRKGFDKFKLTDYYHAAGEDTGNQPMLNYDEVNNLMTVVGGEYRVKDVGIVN